MDLIRFVSNRNRFELILNRVGLDLNRFVPSGYRI